MRATTVFLAVAAFGMCGCGGEQNPMAEKIGQNCTVQFRRGDALGAGGSLPVPPNTNAMNGAEVCVSGKLQSIAPAWVVVAQERREYYIPRESILLIQFDK